MPVGGIQASISAPSLQLNASFLGGIEGIGVDGDSSGSPSCTASSLKTAFNNLVQAIESASSGASSTNSAGSASQPTLQALLQDLIQNLQSLGAQVPKSLGAVVSTAA